MDKRINSGSGYYDYHTVVAPAPTATRSLYTSHPHPHSHSAVQTQYLPQSQSPHIRLSNRTRLQQQLQQQQTPSPSNLKMLSTYHGLNPNALPIIGIHSWQSARHDEQLAANVAAIAAARSRQQQQMTAAAAITTTTPTTAGTIATTTTTPGNLHKQQQYNNNNSSNAKLQRSALPMPAMAEQQQHAATASITPTTTATTTPFRTKPRNKSEEAIGDLLQRIPDIGHIFDVHSRIGNGTFSTVLLATLRRESHLPDSMRRKFAIKHHIPTSHPDRIMKELQCMTDMGGTDNVVGIHCCLRCEASAAFVMPYMPHDRFHDFYTKMDVPEIRLYMRNLLLALRHVHKFNIIHRDVKPSNFLYNRRQGQFLLVDFGLAQHVNITGSGNNLNITGSQQQQQQQPSNLAKRPREPAEEQQQQQQQTSATPTQTASEMSLGGAVKRMRLNDEGQTTSSCSWNKMPLKPVNEIGGRGAADDSGKQQSITEPSEAQSQPTAAATMPLPDLQQQVGVGGGAAAVGGGGGSSSIKYNTNRQAGGGGNNAKCFCFANPSVCINCLMKKEVHASRAGTPGYRPPEVLLKYADQTTAVDVWAAGVIFLSVLSSVYPFFKAPNDFVALAEIVTIFGDRAIRKTALALERMVTISQRSKPLNLRKLCLRFRHRLVFSDAQMIRKHESPDGRCEVCKNCDQYFFNCLCEESDYVTEPLDPYECFPESAYDLLGRLLEINPHKRITAEEALNHPFFTEEPHATGQVAMETSSKQQQQQTTTRRRAAKAPGTAVGLGAGLGVAAGVACTPVEQLNQL